MAFHKKGMHVLDNGVMYRIVYVPAHSTLIFEMELVKIER